MKLFASFFLISALSVFSVSANELVVFSDGPLRTVLPQVAKAYSSTSSNTLQFVYDTAPKIDARLKSGERADVVITLAEEVEKLVKQGTLIHPASSVARIKAALAVRAGMDTPDISTVEKLRDALLKADTLILNNLASGRAVSAKLAEAGILEAIKDKIVVVKGNVHFQELLSRKQNDFAAGQMTQIVADRSLKLAGALPEQVQLQTVYSAGVVAASPRAKEAAAFVTFLASSTARKIISEAGAY